VEEAEEPLERDEEERAGEEKLEWEGGGVQLIRA